MNRFSFLAWFALLAFAASGQTLALKGLRPGRTASIRKLDSPAKRWSLTRSHVLLQFPDNPTADRMDALKESGVVVLGYVPDFGFTASVDDGAALEAAELQWFGRLEPVEKLSPELGAGPDAAGSQAVADGPAWFVVQFYSDVDPNDARGMVLLEGLAIEENADLLPAHLLVAGTPDQALSLAAWDEVEYIFPASADLVQGNAVQACAGALTTQGQVGQSVAKVGDGWDGPGQGGADLYYAFIGLTRKLPADAVKAVFARAFGEWAKYAKLTFTPVDATGGPRTLAVLFAAGSHGDPYPFDGPGGVLAHTFYPFPVNPEPIAGDLHFDDAENWKIGADIDLFSVALHETGHALGLGHSDRPGVVMYPYYRKAAALTQEDIAAILTLYAAQDGAPPPPQPGGGTPAPNPTPNPAPAPPPTPNPAPAPPPSAPLTLTVQSPDATTSGSTASLSGTVSGGAGAPQVTWAISQGTGGAAQGGWNWSISGIPLSPGPNAITITAQDARRAQAAQTVYITRVAPAGRDTTPPSLRVTSPASSTVSTSASSIVVAGTASDNTGVAAVTWSNSNGGSGAANGTASWTTPPIALLIGTNTLTIRAMDAAGNTAWRSVVVTRR